MRGVRTDLSMERLQESRPNVDGVRVSVHSLSNVTHTRIRVTTPEAARRLGRGMGEYATVEYRTCRAAIPAAASL